MYLQVAVHCLVGGNGLLSPIGNGNASSLYAQRQNSKNYYYRHQNSNVNTPGFRLRSFEMSAGGMEASEQKFSCRVSASSFSPTS